MSAVMSYRALRSLTAGSVDDGKSTLIGRLLYDSHAILADPIDVLERRAACAPRAAGEPAFDLSLLTDGLEAEREQGITITAINDVLDIHTLARADAHQLAVNDIGRVVIETRQPLPLQPCADNRVGGALILVDPVSNRTSGALLVERGLG